MRIARLSSEQIQKIKAYRYDCIVEKHEGPFDYDEMWRWRDFDFVKIAGYDVLLPVSQAHYPHITIERVAVSKDEEILTIFLKDKTYEKNEMFSGYLAIAEKVQGESFYVTTLYHERFAFENPKTQKPTSGAGQ